ncbi:hypothetical protein B0H34DRAFT_157795 [Crassisporium funariophilum]|nr:hypothetical protein B0H34DRAFT_157795 [Crassisporium funariophilum]
MDRKRNKKRVFQERTNIQVITMPETDMHFAFPSKNHLLSYTTDEAHPETITDCTANIPTIEVIQHSNLEDAERKARRQTRYARAEAALAESFRHCENAQSRTRELQILALQKATSVLTTHATEARESVEKLRTLLATREADPSVYKSMQRQRWMEEHRHFAADQLSKAVQQHMSTVASSSGTILNPRTTEPLLPKSKVNLINFVESPWRRAPIRTRPRRRNPIPPKPRDDDDEDIVQFFPRIHKHRRPIPLVMKAPKLQPLFTRFVVDPPHHPSATPPDISSNANETSGLKSTAVMAELEPPLGRHTDGFATIFVYPRRTKEEILHEHQVSMPDYAVHLLANFDSTFEKIHGPANSPRTRFALDSNQTPNTPERTQPSALHKSPSLRRISALLSGIPESIFSSRLANGGERHATRASKRFSTPPTLVPIVEYSVEPRFQPLSVSFHSDLSTPTDMIGGEAPGVVDSRVISRLRRRLSNLRRS